MSDSLSEFRFRTPTSSSQTHHYRLCWYMERNATFNNISVISWRSVLLAEGAGENHRSVANHLQTLSRNVVSSTPRHPRGSNS
jgi:hypothetical protein